MGKKTLCPNCGVEVTIPPMVENLVCEKCGTQLLLAHGSKLVLAKPLSTYLNLKTAASGTDSTARVGNSKPFELSEQRQKIAAEFAGVRIAQEKKYRRQGLFSGIMTLVAGAVLSLVLGIQVSLFGMNGFNLAGIVVGILFVMIGTCLTIWFVRVLRSNE